MIRLTAIRPMIWTRQLKETVAFYEQQLGFTCSAYSEEWSWAALQRDEVELMACLPPEAEIFDRPAFTGSFYIRVDGGIDQLWEEWNGKVRVCYPLETFPYGMREFAVFDNNGYLLQFGQEVGNTS